jgi:mannose-6-phosphate isomerase-like protein (cupin superfamily)
MRVMADYTKLNLVDDVEDMAPKFGYAPHLQSRFARRALGLEQSGLSLFRVEPGYRIPFGHVHETQEEVYVLVSGGARLKLDDDVVELRPWDAVRIPTWTMRAFEAGPDGAELLAFGAPNTENKDAEMVQGWWD